MYNSMGLEHLIMTGTGVDFCNKKAFKSDTFLVAKEEFVGSL